jgi:hypothetical protein
MTDREFGLFVNPDGYSLVKRPGPHFYRPKWANGLPLFRVTLYEFTLSDLHPLTFRTPGHWHYRPDRHFVTDMGSIPRPLQLLFPKDEFLLSYLFHDSLCLHRKQFVSASLDGEYRPARMDSVEAARQLRTQIRAEGGSAVRAATVYGAVRLFGPRWE